MEFRTRVLQAWEPKMERIVDLASNDTLQLSRDPRVIQAAVDGLHLYGVGSGGSPLVCGFKRAHADLIETVCAWHQMPAGLVWNSGFVANWSLLSVLPNPSDIILMDHAIHRSFLEGARSSQAQALRFRHNDIAHLEKLLKTYMHSTARCYVVVESLYSMGGDIAALAHIADLKNKYKFVLMVDEAHALGWYGPQGKGLCAQFGIASQIDILIGPMGKALGTTGCYTLFRDNRWARQCVNYAPGMIYSTLFPPACAMASLKAIEIVQQMNEERVHWQAEAKKIRERLSPLRQIKTNDAPDGPIVPWIIGSCQDTLSVHATLHNVGIRTGCIRPPTVPEGTARLRLSFKRQMQSDALAQRIVEACTP